MGPLCTGATGHGNAPYAGPRMTYPSADIGNASTPVAIFAFARPDHPRRTIQSLQANAEAALTHVTVYCDGTRNQLRSETSRVGTECVSTWRSRGSPYQYKRNSKSLTKKQ